MKIVNKANITGDWVNFIEEAKCLIDGMKPWDALASYMTKVRSIMDPQDEAFASVIEAGSFRLEMKYGELCWEFFMPKTSTVVTSCRKEITFTWDEFVPGTIITYAKEIGIPYRDCGIDGLVATIKEEMDKAMGNAMADDILDSIDNIDAASEPDSIKIQVKDMIESGKFEDKFETYLYIDTKSPYDFYRIVKEVRTALEYTLCDCSDAVRRFFSRGCFVYDCGALEGDNLSFQYDDKDQYDGEDFNNRVKFTLTVNPSRSDYEPRSESLTVQLDSNIH